MSLTGELHIISGSMFSGKTTALLNLIKLHNNNIVINHSLDNRYSSENVIQSHDGKLNYCYKVSSISSIFEKDEFKASSIIFIDEGQFFSNLKDDVLKMVEFYNKTVYIAGLLVDSQRNKFGELLDLIPFADTFVLKKSLCSMCKTQPQSSTYSYKLNNTNIEVICVGTNIDYTSLCRYHYLKNKT